MEFLDHRDGVIEYGASLRRDIAAAVRRHRPELVITLNHRDTWAAGAWNTPDHVAVGRAVLDAAADAGNRWIFPELAEQGWCPGTVSAGWPSPTHRRVPRRVRRAGLRTGVRSLLRHRTYLEALTAEDPETYARRFLGESTGVHRARFDGAPAVAFELFSR